MATQRNNVKLNTN